MRLHDMQLLDCDKNYIGGTEVSTVIKLKVGLHPYVLGYRHGSSGVAQLRLSWSSSKIAKEPVPESLYGMIDPHSGN